MTEIRQELDMTRIPQHIAIIMDGNGRWATERGKDRSFGHQAGVDTVRRITKECVHLGVKYLTLYTFSTENWNRPADEISALMGLVLTSLEDEIFMKNNVRFRVIGDLKRLPDAIPCIRIFRLHISIKGKRKITFNMPKSSAVDIPETRRRIQKISLLQNPKVKTLKRSGRKLHPGQLIPCFQKVGPHVRGKRTPVFPERIVIRMILIKTKLVIEAEAHENVQIQRFLFVVVIVPEQAVCFCVCP